MRKKLYNASFEESETLIKDDFIEETIHKIETFKPMAAVFGISFFILPLFFIYFVGHSILKMFSEHFILFDTSYPTLIIVFLLYSMCIISSFFKNYKNILIPITFLLFMYILLFVYILYSFVFFNFFVDNLYLKLLYCIAAVLIYFYFNTRTNKPIIHSLYENYEYSNKIFTFIEKNIKPILSIVSLLISIRLIISMFFSISGFSFEISNTTKDIFLQLSPLVSIFAIPMLFFLKPKLIQNYYVVKYAESYRKKYQISNEIWYGKNSKQFQSYLNRKA